jgi:hypothetical protein
LASDSRYAQNAPKEGAGLTPSEAKEAHS